MSDHRSMSGPSNRGTTASEGETERDTHHYTKSKICGVLGDLKDDIVLQQGNTCSEPVYSGHANLSGTDNVYVEQSGGRFKLSRVEDGVFCEDQATSNCLVLRETPLDVAISVQKAWGALSRLCIGLLGGIALYQLLLVNTLQTNGEHWVNFIATYAPLQTIPMTLFYVTTVIIVIFFFDVLDVGHLSSSHLADTIAFRGNCLVLVLYVVLLFICTGNVVYEDYFMFFNITGSGSGEELGRSTLMWNTLNITRCLLALVGSLLIMFTSFDDLFLLHLVAMKKYEEIPKTQH